MHGWRKIGFSDCHLVSQKSKEGESRKEERESENLHFTGHNNDDKHSREVKRYIA